MYEILQTCWESPKTHRSFGPPSQGPHVEQVPSPVFLFSGQISFGGGNLSFEVKSGGKEVLLDARSPSQLAGRQNVGRSPPRFDSLLFAHFVLMAFEN